MKDVSQIVGELRIASSKLHGIAWLIECQGNPAAFPLNLSDINYGIGLIVGELAEEILTAPREIEKFQLQEAKSKRKASQSELTRKPA